MPFHNCVMACPAPKAQDNDQFWTGAPRLVTVTFAPNPPGHCELIEYETWHPAAACAEALVTTVRPAAASVAAAATASQDR